MEVNCLYCHASSCCCLCFIVKQLPRQTGLIHQFIYEEAITKCAPAAAARPLPSLNLFSFALQRLLVSEYIVVLSINTDMAQAKCDWWLSDLIAILLGWINSRYYNEEHFPVLQVFGHDQPRLFKDRAFKYSFLLYRLCKIGYFHLHVWQEYASKWGREIRREGSQSGSRWCTVILTGVE